MLKAIFWTSLTFGALSAQLGGGGAPAKPLFDGFEGSTIANFWLPGSYGSGRYSPGAVTISDKYARSGKTCVEITIREGDVEQDGGDGAKTERDELDSGAYPLLGSEAWYGFSALLPKDFPVVDNRLVFAQWKQKDVAGPLVAQRFRAGRHYLTIRTGEGQAQELELPPLALGRWNDMIYHIRYSEQSNGLVEVWMNGTQVASWGGATAFAGGRNGFYSKIGLYRDRWKEPMTIFLDNYTLGNARDAVDPSRFDRGPGRQ
jgi:hypothetical protein